MGVARAVMVLLAKDVKLLGRRVSEVLSLVIVTSVVGVAVAYLVSAPVTIPLSGDAASVVMAAGQLVSMFIAAVAAGFLAVLREAEKGTLDGIRSTPVPPEAVYLSKMLYIYALTVLISVPYTVTASAFSSSWSMMSIPYLVVLLIVALYFSAAAALTAFMIVYSEARSLLSMVVLAGLLTPFLQDAGRVLAYTAVSHTLTADTLNILAAALAFTAIATLASKPLAEI